MRCNLFADCSIQMYVVFAFFTFTVQVISRFRIVNILYVYCVGCFAGYRVSESVIAMFTSFNLIVMITDRLSEKFGQDCKVSKCLLFKKQGW